MNKGGTPENLKPWEKGQSGNPKGRPKSKHISDNIKEILAEIPKNGDGRNNQELLLRKLVREAYRGKPWAFKELMDRGFGKPTQVVETTPSLVINTEAKTPEEASKAYNKIMKEG